MPDIKPLLEEIDKQIKELSVEYGKVSSEYWDSKRWCWRISRLFFASDYKYYKDFCGRAHPKEYEERSAPAYLGFLNARIKNLKRKKNQIIWKNFGR